MPGETMTPRERWLAVLNRQKPDRVPMDYWATPEATGKLMRYLKCESPGPYGLLGYPGGHGKTYEVFEMRKQGGLI